MFMQMTGYDPATGMSGPIVLIDGNGQLGLYQITDYFTTRTSCTAACLTR